METCEKPVFGVSLLKECQDKTVCSVNDSRYKGVFYESPERAVKAFSKMVEYRRFHRKMTWVFSGSNMHVPKISLKRDD